jgi:pilus assembly protein CpaD
MISDTAPVTSGFINPGQARVVITRSSAAVPGCPDWSANSDMNYTNGTSPNFGCANNSNLAAMVADPQDLLEGKKGSGETVILTSNKAISTYRETAPTGADGLQDASAGGGGGGGGGGQGGGN